MRTRRAPWLCVALASLALAPAAHAGDPFVAIAETGAHDPDVAIDGNGNAHIAWVSDQASGAATEKRLRYCVVGPAASACAPQTVRTLFPLTEPSEALVGDPSIFITAAGEVIVVSSITVPGDSGTRAFRSTENFAPRIIGPLLNEHALGPGAAISLLSETGTQYFLGPLSGASASSPMATLPSGGSGGAVIGEGTRVASFGGTRALVVRDENSGTVFNTSNGSDPNNSANWSAAQPITPSGDNSIVASGPNGLVLAYETGSSAGTQFQARVFDGTAFGASVPITTGLDPIDPDLYADQISGAFHFVYSDDERDLRWVASNDGTNWSQPILIVRDEQRPDIDPPSIAGGAIGGLVVWQGNPDTGPQTGSGKIWAARLSGTDSDGDGVPDDTDPCPAQAGSDGNGCPGGARCSEVNCAPPADGRKGNPTLVFGDARNTLEVVVPSCEANKVALRVKLKRKRVRQRGDVKIVTKVRKVIFKLKRRKKVDRKPPYRKSFPLRNAVPGATYKMRAIVKLRVRRGDDPPTRKTLKLNRRFRICPGGLT